VVEDQDGVAGVVGGIAGGGEDARGADCTSANRSERASMASKIAGG